MRRVVALCFAFTLAAVAACGNVESSDADAAPPGDPDAAPPSGDVDATPTADAPPAQRFALTLTVSGAGIVTSDPAGIVCGDDCTEEFDETQSVTLTVLPGPNAAFVGWSGDGCDGAAPTCAVAMSQARSITATFKVGYTLTVTKEGGGVGTVTSEPTGIDCGEVCQAGFDENTRVTLTAAHSDNAAFKGWSGDDNGCSDTSLTCVVTLDRARAVVATLTAMFRLSLTVQGGGSVMATLAGGTTSFSCAANSSCTRDYESGTAVTLSAAPSNGFTFKEWTGSCAGASTSCTLTVDRAMATAAVFVPIFTLTMTTITGSTTGTVTMRAPGYADVVCAPNRTCSEPYAAGTVVALSRSADNDDTVFDAWSGACAGSSSTCQVTMTEAKSVTARFRKEYELNIIAYFESGAGGRNGLVRVSRNGSVVAVCETTGGMADCKYRFAPGTTLTIQGVNGTCSLFLGFSASWPNTNPVTIVMNQRHAGFAMFMGTCP